ncbi:MAG: response regulator [Candidatus Omnitrophica bacterium]|nr:response regulator [Candidatus Omnitrophota bacterium]
MRKLRVLVIDDKSIVGDLFDFTLGYAGHDVVCFDDVAAALKAVEEEKFDIAFVDIIMPEMDGVTLMSNIKKINADIPIVMMTGFSVEAKRKEMRDLGAVACLQKPFELEDVQKLIKVVLDRKI